MEPTYRQFRSPESGSVYEIEHSIPTPKSLRSAVAYFLYGVLVLLLLILLMVVGIKFSQVNKEISLVKQHLESMRKEGVPSASHAALKDVPLQRVVPVRGSCREGWSSFQRSCYLLSTTAVAWSVAEQQCRTHEGHLLVVNTVEELDYISEIVEIKYNYWIGLVEREEDNWTWVDGTDFHSTPTFWDEGQPDNWDFRENGEDCGQFHSSTIRKRKLSNDADCSLPYRYICERKA